MIFVYLQIIFNMSMNMKFLSTLGILAFGITAAQAQITVTSNDFTLPIGNDKITTLLTDNMDSVAAPTVGNDQLWNYGGVNIVDSFQFSYDANTNTTGFASSNAMIASDLVFGNFSVDNITSYISKTNEAVKVDGHEIERQVFDLAAATDSLVVLEQDVLTNGIIPQISFDLNSTYDESFSAKDTFKFELTYVTGGMNSVPGYLLRTYNTDIKVEGWGKVVMPKTNDTIEALLVKSTISIYDTVFVNGSRINPSLLVGTNIQEGMLGSFTSHLLVGKGYKSPLATISYDDSMNVSDVEFLSTYADVDTGTSINNISKVAIKAYPNPTTSDLTLALEKGKSYMVNVYDVNGRLVISRKVDNNTLALSDVIAGSYMATVNDGQKEIGFVKFIKH